MPFKAKKLEQSYRIAPVVVTLLNDRNEPEDVTLNVKYRPLTMQKIAEWASIADAAKSKTNGNKESPTGDEPAAEKNTLCRQLAEVVIDLDLVEDDGVTPKAVTAEYLETLDLGFLKDIQEVIVDRAFPEKKAWAAMTR